MPQGLALGLVRDSMTRTVRAIEPGTKVDEAIAVMREHSVSHLPVVKEGIAVGVLCTCDLEAAPADSDVSAVMHSPVVSVPPNRTLAEAAELMSARGVGSVLVLDGHELVGILTRTDLEKAGLVEAAFGERRCNRCQSYHHVRADRCGYLLCAECRASGTAKPGA